jgi:aminoglycoside 6'-N-acetyltransferase I
MIRRLHEKDVETLAHLRDALWPGGTVDGHARELRTILSGAWGEYVVFVAEIDGEIAGFVEVALRPWGAGYLEGWYVRDEHRRKGIGAQLVQAFEEWARAHNCVELASDTWLDNEVSQRAHEALGFEEAERVIGYRKKL